MTRRDSVVLLSRQGEASLRPEDLARLRTVAEVAAHALNDAPVEDSAAALLAPATVLAATNVVLPDLTSALLERLPRLRAVVLYATGVDHIDLDLLERRRVALVAMPEYATTAVAEHALAQVVALATRLHLAHDRSRAWVPADTSLRGIELRGRILGIVGTGRVGRDLAALGNGVRMRVRGADIDPAARAAARAAGIEVVELDELLRTSDVLAMCCSHRYGRPPVLGRREVQLLRPGAFVANIGRPALVDTCAVSDALRAGRIRGYAVDDVVLDPVADADLLVRGLVLQTGHSAWWRDEVLDRGRRMWADAVLDVVTRAAGGPPPHGAVVWPDDIAPSSPGRGDDVRARA